MPKNLNKPQRAKYISFAVFVTLLSSILSITLLLTALELYLRYTSSNNEYPTEGMIRYDDTRGWALNEGSYASINLNAQGKTVITINSLGLREKEISPEVPADKKRVSVIGDSFVFSTALNYGERFTETLSNKLGNLWQVVNISTSGYGTGQELLTIEHLESKGYDAGDIVFLVFFTNDILDNIGLEYSSMKRNIRQPVFKANDSRLEISEAPKNIVAKSATTHKSLYPDLKVVDFIKKTGADWIGRNPNITNALSSVGLNIKFPRTPGLINGWFTEGWGDRWNVTSALLRYSARKFSQKTFVILYIPSPLQIEPAMLNIMTEYATHDQRFSDFIQDKDRPQNTLKEFCKENNVLFVDATPALRKAAKKQPVYFLGEGHLNNAGTEVLATEMHKFILNNRVSD